MEEQKVQGGERGSDGRESPTSAVTTTRLAAVAADCDYCSNKADSCHKHRLLNMAHMYAHLWTHTHTHAHEHTHTLILLRRHSLPSRFMAACYLSFLFLLSDKTAAAVIALCSL